MYETPSQLTDRRTDSQIGSGLQATLLGCRFRVFDKRHMSRHRLPPTNTTCECCQFRVFCVSVAITEYYQQTRHVSALSSVCSVCPFPSQGTINFVLSWVCCVCPSPSQNIINKHEMCPTRLAFALSLLSTLVTTMQQTRYFSALSSVYCVCPLL